MKIRESGLLVGMLLLVGVLTETRTTCRRCHLPVPPPSVRAARRPVFDAPSDAAERQVVGLAEELTGGSK